MKKPIKTQEEFRSRWRRWLGQVFRNEGRLSIVLMDASLKGWPEKVLSRPPNEHEQLYHYWRAAISVASTQQLQRLNYLVSTP